MNSSVNIRLLGSSNNERGDLFTRLSRDLFFALGYDNLRLNVHKSGRELDLVGEHRFEPRRVIAECKAHADKMGGAELNKFYGALTRERKKSHTCEVAGYFVSLSGFTETGVEQEIETGDDRLILLDAAKVVDELERCHAIVARAEATERAGQCATQAALKRTKLHSLELLGHEAGYLWTVFYEQGKKRTHFTLIHADGTPVHETIAHDVIKIDKLCGGSLYSLQYLPPPVTAPERLALSAKVATNYRQWLGEECGYIYLDGMPADTDLSATRLKLERLFVPLKSTFLPKPDDSPEVKQKLNEDILPIGEVLKRAPHLAILAAPGGGKSTLLKRLATAYAFVERREQISDDLPEREWMPLFLRCRELRDRAHRPIIELLDDIPRHAGMSADESTIFQESVHSALHAGKALLLIDGLDEISDEGARQTFASHLRTFLAMFPQVALVVTSREAGFRLVAGVIASACRQAKIASLDEHDVLNLCERWHVEVVGDNNKVRVEAKELGQSIWGNERIRRLAENPLLLTTLLVVRRWIGELPRSRAGLYREAIRVLVRTWNVEGFAPLDEDETLAQLSYVACSMMEQGTQQIGQKALLKLLQSARRELEAELQFARIAPQEFIDRIEYRSSLLMQTGVERIDGTLEPVYEFRHLTFQEYLAARGYVEEQYPGRNSGQSLSDLLESHFNDEWWREVIPLAAVLAGRRAEDLIKQLIVAGENLDPKPGLSPRLRNSDGLLYQCIQDEVQITGATLRSALLRLGRCPGRSHVLSEDKWVAGILHGKFADLFQGLVEQAYVSGGEQFEEYLSSHKEIVVQKYFETHQSSTLDVAVLKGALESDNRISKIGAALVVMRLARLSGQRSRQKGEKIIPKVDFQSLVDALTAMVSIHDLPCALASSWALAWIGQNQLLVKPPTPELLLSLFKVWQQSKSFTQARYVAWALAVQALIPRESFDREMWGDCDTFLIDAAKRPSREGEAALIIGWYRRSPWNNEKLAELVGRRSFERAGTMIELLQNLGKAGQRVLNSRKLAKGKQQTKQTIEGE